MALPDQTDLPLSNGDKTALIKLSNKTCKNFSERLKAWADFYGNHSIVYNKLKHGLSLTTAYHVRDETGVDVKDFSLSFAYDRTGNRKRTPPRNSLFLSGQILEGTWFDTVNIIPFSEDNLTLYMSLANEIDDWIGYIVGNQMTWAENCGMGYLPGNLKLEQKLYHVQYKCQAEGLDGVLADLRPAFEKITKKMYINPDRTVLVEFYMSTDKAVPKLLTVLNTWRSATISISSTHESAPPAMAETRLFDVKLKSAENAHH